MLDKWKTVVISITLLGAVLVVSYDFVRDYIYSFAGGFSDRYSEVDRAARNNPKDPGARRHRARLRAALGDREGAVEDYTAAIEFYTENSADLASIYSARASQYQILAEKQTNLEIQKKLCQQASADYRMAANLYQQNGNIYLYGDILRWIPRC